jgi:hypothetical protein
LLPQIGPILAPLWMEGYTQRGARDRWTPGQPLTPQIGVIQTARALLQSRAIGARAPRPCIGPPLLHGGRSCIRTPDTPASSSYPETATPAGPSKPAGVVMLTVPRRFPQGSRPSVTGNTGKWHKIVLPCGPAAGRSPWAPRPAGRRSPREPAGGVVGRAPVYGTRGAD